VKVACTVWTGGKAGDNFKGLPVRNVPSSNGEWSHYSGKARQFLSELKGYIEESNEEVTLGRVLS